ncbi:MAG: peptidase [Alphaproteobacteria bacterium]|nr:peptidase [Alphaproteobacteria bacterium]MDB5720235.1 peptidase [Alphaproteobacteria bacterium]
MAEADPRVVLERLIRERGEDYAGLSRLIGRNAAYIQQYIKRGSPRRLAEEDRHQLALYFGIDEAMLGGREGGDPAADLVAVPRLDVGASAGAGALDPEERQLGRIGFDPLWLRRLGISDGKALSVIRVQGDSMTPTLSDGDEILVDRGDGAPRLRDGIYVLRLEDTLVVKRLALSPAASRVSILSDNQAYPGWPDCALSAIDVVGRVVWVGRRLG